jgi:hypothetical protein
LRLGVRQSLSPVIALSLDSAPRPSSHVRSLPASLDLRQKNLSSSRFLTARARRPEGWAAIAAHRHQSRRRRRPPKAESEGVSNGCCAREERTAIRKAITAIAKPCLHLLNVRSRWSKQLRWARRLSSRCRAANRFRRTVRRLVPRPARRSRFLGQMRWQHDRSLAIQTASNYRLRICRCAYRRQPRARPSALHSGHARPLCRLAAIDCRFLSYVQGGEQD